jgi:UDP-N-acetyl-2-amino-2-deoxyglucuronate dehydrogenase
VKTSTSPVRIALVGCGAIGEEVARRVYAAPTSDRYRLVAAVDTRADRAAVVAGPLGIPAVGSLDEAVAAGLDVDAVDCRLPHHLHADAAVAALARGLHVLVEKPLATSLSDGARLVAAAARGTAVAAVAENYPHLLAVKAASAAIAGGVVGSLRAVRTTRAYTLGGIWIRDGWRRGGGPSAGILLDQGTHHTSLLRQLGGEIASVSAHASTTRTECGGDSGETVLLTARFRSGLVGQSLYSWGTPALDDQAEATIFGSAGRIDVRVSYQADLGHARHYDGTSLTGVALSPAENYYDSHRLIVDDWVSAITEHRPPMVTVADAYVDLAVVLAAAMSLSERGRGVEIAELGQA